MPRIRSIKPEIWLSAQVMNLTFPARLLFIGLITQADDDGYGSSDVRKLKAAIFGGDDITLDQVSEMLSEIARQRLVVIYEADGYGALYWLPSWREHQYVQKPTPSRYPPPENTTLPERYRNHTGTLPGDRMDRKDRKGSDARAKTGPALGQKAAPARRASEAELQPISTAEALAVLGGAQQ